MLIRHKIPTIHVSSFAAAAEQAIIMGVIEREYNNKTCIRWRPLKISDKNAVIITPRSAGCFTPAGMQGGFQIMNLEQNWCVNHDTVTHEMMHSIGFFHQQSAPDRDEYIKIFKDNIKLGEEPNFLKYGHEFDANFAGGYDYQSIMHYERTAFSINKEETMAPKVSSPKLNTFYQVL